MKNEDIYKIIMGYFSDRNKKIDEKTNIFEADIMDSMDIIDLVVYIEYKLGIALEQNDLKKENFETVSHIIRTIKKTAGFSEE